MEEFKKLVEPLILWFHKNKRELPWRQNTDPYRIWISEIMLQQTRVEAVKPYYERFLCALPTVKSLAEVNEDELLKLWEGLGYYSRAKNLKKAAVKIMCEFEGDFPKTKKELETLPGIGSYTSGAIASIAFGERVPAVDGNVLRVMSRVAADSSDILNGKVKKKWEEIMQEITPADCPGTFNQALMDLGATICTPNGVPHCEECPWGEICQARKKELTGSIPYKTPKKPRRMEEKTLLIIRDEHEILMQKRPKTGLLAGLYEFPNIEGKQKEKRILEYMKELEIPIIKIKKLPEVKHIFSHVEWHMIGYIIQVDELSEEKNFPEGTVLVDHDDFVEKIPLPTAFSYYNEWIWN